MTGGKNVLGGIVTGERMTGGNRDRGEECPGGRMSGHQLTLCNLQAYGMGCNVYR